uniref:Gelsolin-like domain-containing protein n=1 Tax=Lepeophtheirus salmonis TaxID=72036 RepID=A0A0K2U430_LEPSM
MAVGPGVLSFIRGLDLTKNDLEDDKFPGEALEHMSSLRWLKLTNTKLKSIPDQLVKLNTLEHLTLKRNQVGEINPGIAKLSSLRTLNLSRNQISSSGVPSQLFDNEELTTLDISHNKLSSVPEGISNCKSLLVLNMSHNQLETIPSSVLMSLTDLLYFDVSHNDLDTLPPQLRRLANLQTLDLSFNPLSHFQIRPLPSLTELKVLSMKSTQRTNSNIPGNLEALVHLSDVDLSENNLTKIPEGLLTVPNIRRLNLGDNQISEVSQDIERWQGSLETFILSRNKIKVLPTSLCKLSKLKKLYLNENELDFEGIPKGVAKLVELVTFSAADNKLEMIPEGLCRCNSLKKLILPRNRLITLPDAIHLTELEILDLKGNTDLIMPPKPMQLSYGAGVEFYNVDFSLQHQLRLAGASVPKSIAEQQNNKSDPMARKMRLRRRHWYNSGDPDEDQAKVLKGMKDIAKANKSGDKDQIEENESIKAKRWDEALEKPPLDYSEFFDTDVGQFPGISIWEIENFYPKQIEEEAYGNFYEGDCYIVLHTSVDDSGSLDWKIYFLIGDKASLDKRTCSAIHSVNLRNYLGANGRTVREEQGDESEEFLQLFGGHIDYIQGAHTTSGFYTVEEIEYTTRTYRIHTDSTNAIHFEPVKTEYAMLDSRYVFLVDAGLQLFVWYGKNCKNVLKSKARLLAEKICKQERKNKASISIFSQNDEPSEFWRILFNEEEDNHEDEGASSDGEVNEENESRCSNFKAPKEPIVDHVPNDFKPVIPRLYIVGLGMGYLELPQVEVPGLRLKQDLLETKSVYILDCFCDLFVWIGKKSTKLVRAAALKLSSELFSMIKRPDYSMVHRVSEGTESQIFKTKFFGWDDVIGVDFTRTAQSVQRTGADLVKWAKAQDTKVDLSALFTPRQSPMAKEEAQQLSEEWNEDLEKMEAFVLEGKKFVKLPEEERGIFHSADSYVYLCRYWVPADEQDKENEHEDDEDDVEDYQGVVVYFWQGRDSSNMGWLTFTFSLQKKFETLFGEKLEVLRMHQQQETLKFMSHFKNGLIIRQGSRNASKKPDYVSSAELYHIRSNGSSLCRRCVQIKSDASLLNSCFCYVLKVPFDTKGDSGIIYVWIGSTSDSDEANVAQNIASTLWDPEKYSCQILNEGEEPENFFWVGLNGKKNYEKEADFMDLARLFRCSNEKGYFTVSEKCSDFCQDDLAQDDIMILDTGDQVFLWMGPRCSEVEVKLSYKSAQVYIQNLRAKYPDRVRKLFLTIMGKESKRFTRCFHGWGTIKSILR